MSTSYLLDTSVLVFVLKENAAILKRMSGADLYVSSISLGELYYGAEHSIYVEKSRDQVNKLAESMTILEANKATAQIYGRFKHEQRMKGLLLPDNDLWIASTAIQYSITLAARDRHFMWIAGLAQEQW